MSKNQNKNKIVRIARLFLSSRYLSLITSTHLDKLLNRYRKSVNNNNKMKISELPGDEDAGPTCRTYVFQNESHTLGNALKCIINRYEDVEFCGYTVPHPAESKMHFRIQARETPALEILKRGLKDLEKVCDHTIDLFEKEVKDYIKT